MNHRALLALAAALLAMNVGCHQWPYPQSQSESLWEPFYYGDQMAGPVANCEPCSYYAPDACCAQGGFACDTQGCCDSKGYDHGCCDHGCSNPGHGGSCTAECGPCDNGCGGCYAGGSGASGPVVSGRLRAIAAGLSRQRGASMPDCGPRPVVSTRGGYNAAPNQLCGSCGGAGCGLCGMGPHACLETAAGKLSSAVSAMPVAAKIQEHAANGYCGGQVGPSMGAVQYPYYTTRGPRDFLMSNPPSIGP